MNNKLALATGKALASAASAIATTTGKVKIATAIIINSLIFSQLLLGCSQGSTISSTRSKQSQNPTQTEQTVPTYKNCRFDVAVNSMINQLRDNATYLVIEQAKTLYYDVKSEPNCEGQTKSLSGVLRPVWQSAVNTRAQRIYIMCITSCIGSNSNECSPKCEEERSSSVNSETDTIRNFFASN